MWKLAVSVMALVALGCAKGAGEEVSACAHAVDLCDHGDGVEECVAEMAALEPKLGRQYDTFLGCVTGAKSCGEYISCAVRGLGKEDAMRLGSIRRRLGTGRGAGATR